jgi:hypothetical protein
MIGKSDREELARAVKIRMKAARSVVEQADERIAAVCREHGIPEEFRPSLRVVWYNRGQNAIRERRDELRKLAVKQADALAKKALAAIEMKSANMLTQLIAGGLGSDEAKAFLESIPTPTQLMPLLEVDLLKIEVKPLRDNVSIED